MNLSSMGINKLKELEGCVKCGGKHVVYDDKTGKPVNVNKPLPTGATIGYGHLIRPGEDFIDGITEECATELLRRDIASVERGVGDTVKIPLAQNQYDAVVILVYNIGVQNFMVSTIVKYINNPNFHSVRYPTLKSAWLAWNRAHGAVSSGLNHRRMVEWEIYSHARY